MIKLVKFLAGSIVSQPKEVKVTSQKDASGTEMITLSVSDEDMGRIIGKNGKIISAIRELIKVKAIRNSQRVRLTLKDPRKTDQPSPSEQSELPVQS